MPCRPAAFASPSSTASISMRRRGARAVEGAFSRLERNGFRSKRDAQHLLRAGLQPSIHSSGFRFAVNAPGGLRNRHDIVPPPARRVVASLGNQNMKIVAFEGQGGPHLGVVEGDQVVDLQAVDSKIPAILASGSPRTTATPSNSRRSPKARQRPRANRLPASNTRCRSASRARSSVSGSIISNTSRKARSATIFRNSRPSSFAA